MIIIASILHANDDTFILSRLFKTWPSSAFHLIYTQISVFYGLEFDKHEGMVFETFIWIWCKHVWFSLGSDERLGEF